MPNPWIEHVKKFAKRKGISYSEALKKAKSSYGTDKKEVKKKRRTVKKEVKRRSDDTRSDDTRSDDTDDTIYDYDSETGDLIPRRKKVPKKRRTEKRRTEDVVQNDRYAPLPPIKRPKFHPRFLNGVRVKLAKTPQELLTRPIFRR